MSESIHIPDGLVHVGWFCHHGPSTYNSDTRKYEHEVPHRSWHRKKDGEWKAKKEPNTIQSLGSLAYWEPDEPACPLAVPMLVSETSDAAINFLAAKS